MGIRNRVQSIPLTTMNAAALVAQLAPINPNGLDEACFMIRITNDSNSDITISFNGEDDNDIVLADSVVDLDFQTNSASPDFKAWLAKGTKVYASGAAGVGTIYLSGYYQLPGR